MQESRVFLELVKMVLISDMSVVGKGSMLPSFDRASYRSAMAAKARSIILRRSANDRLATSLVAL